MVPLIGVELDLDPVAIGVLVAAGTTADFLLFPISGYIMDRWARLMSMVPAFSLMVLGLAMLGIADFQTLSAAGPFSGPLLVGWVADISGLGTAAIALSVTLAAGVAWIALVIGETGKLSDARV